MKLNGATTAVAADNDDSDDAGEVAEEEGGGEAEQWKEKPKNQQEEEENELTESDSLLWSTKNVNRLHEIYIFFLSLYFTHPPKENKADSLFNILNVFSY